MKPKILLVNDDGINAPGLMHLSQALAPIADLWVVAPAQEQSGVGASVTLRTPLSMTPVNWPDNILAWKVNGTPVDCVRFGINLAMKERPDLVVSGINAGTNAGRNTLYSGTVGGIIDATHQGIPGIAFSCYAFHNPNYEETKPYIRSIVMQVLEAPLPKGTFLNVNFPKTSNGFKGVKLARQGLGYFKDNLTKRTHPFGNEYYWMGFATNDFDEGQETDIHLMNEGFVAIAPIHVNDMTDHAYFLANKEVFEALTSPEGASPAFS